MALSHDETVVYVRLLNGANTSPVAAIRLSDGVVMWISSESHGGLAAMSMLEGLSVGSELDSGSPLSGAVYLQSIGGIYALKATDGTILPGWPITDCVGVANVVVRARPGQSDLLYASCLLLRTVKAYDAETRTEVNLPIS